MTTPPVLLTDWPDLPVTPQRSQQLGHRRFPVRRDYELALVQAGIIASPDELWRSPILVAAIQRHWHHTGQTGCLFARLLANRMTKQEWPVIVAPRSAWENAATLSVLDQMLSTATATPGCEIVSVLFPEVVGVAELRELVSALAQAGIWNQHEQSIGSAEVFVQLRRPVTSAVALAWIMAFGPYPDWPSTRRGPLTEFAIRVKPKPASLFPELNQDPSAAHLADSPTGLSDERTAQLIARTHSATSDVLGASADARSAARTTFSFPAAKWWSTTPDAAAEQRAAPPSADALKQPSRSGAPTRTQRRRPSTDAVPEPSRPR